MKTFVAECPCCHGEGQLLVFGDKLPSTGLPTFCCHCQGRGEIAAEVDKPRIGNPIQTFSGHLFYPLDPRPEEVFIEDIAAALSKLCRFGGHTRKFYTVGEHSVWCSRYAPPGLQLAALLHDATEAYAGDVITPIKRELPAYADIESRLATVIAQRFDVPLHPLPAEIKHIDRAILADEVRQNLAPSSCSWPEIQPLGVQLEYWAPERACKEFLRAFAQYGGVE
jgi:hypothetical protein